MYREVCLGLGSSYTFIVLVFSGDYIVTGAKSAEIVYKQLL